jgi:hypothetical protein
MLIGDKGCDADHLRHFQVAQGTEAVMKPMPNRIHKRDFDPFA